MSKTMRNMVLLAKLQPSVGVDPVPTGGANAILVKGLSPSIIKGDFVERSLLRGYKGNSGKLVAGEHRAFEFEVELAGSGAAGTAPKWGPLMLGCGFSETVTAATKVEYAPVSTGESLVTLYAWLDGILFKMLDARGTVSFDLSAKGIPMAKFSYLGAYSAATDDVIPAGIDFSGFQKPRTVGKVNTPTFTFHGVSAPAQQFTLDVANELIWNELINYSAAEIPDRQPAGTAVIELPSVATMNIGEILRAGTEDAVQLVHGTTAGNIVQFDLPQVQLTSEPTINEGPGGKAMVSLGFSANPNTGNDEMTLTVK